MSDSSASSCLHPEAARFLKQNSGAAPWEVGWQALRDADLNKTRDTCEFSGIIFDLKVPSEQLSGGKV